MKQITLEYTQLQSKTCNLKLTLEGHKSSYSANEIRDALKKSSVWKPERYLAKTDEWLINNFI
ncbi:hypothetical protein T190611E02C_40310 [Tenacibaculum sp. 190524A05c]